jgi:hypothetical protein
MLAIAAGKGIEVAIDAFRSQRIANEFTKSQAVEDYSPRACPRCSGAKELLKQFRCELCELLRAV